MPEPAEKIFTNARIVLQDRVVDGTLVVRDGLIEAIDRGKSDAADATDCDGDYLSPGLIELHTDNLERHMRPRPGVDWPHTAAIVAHDGELASVGITTVFDAIRVGSIVSATRTRYGRYGRQMANEILQMRAAGALRVSHFLHLRAEVCSETLTEELAEFTPEDRVGILSLMDHTPGQRQFRNLVQLRTYLRGKHSMSESEMDDHIAHLKVLRDRIGDVHEKAAVAESARLGATLASHDDTTGDQVAISAGYGVKLAEFPTTEEAARACQSKDISVMMGAPNLIRGRSHSGNVAAKTLADGGLLDILSSDYVPSSLLTAAVQHGHETGDMAAAIATVTSAPAKAVSLSDRGHLAPGLRADLVRFRVVGRCPVVRGSWVQGRRIA